MRLRFIQSLVVLTLLNACVSKVDNTEKLNEKSKLKYAETYELFEKNGIQLFHLVNPESKKIEKRFAFVKSSLDNIPTGYTAIQVPIKSIIALSATQIGMLAKLKETRLVTGVSNHIYVQDQTVLKNFKKGKVIEMGDENGIPVELIIQSHANLLFYSGFGTTFPHEKQLEKMNIYCLAVYDWKEKHPLGKAEWIKLYGILTGKEQEANTYFTKIEKEYTDLIQKAKKAQKHPTLFSGNMGGDVWNSPAGESFNAILFKDAGGKYVYANTKGTGSIQHSFEQILKDNRETEFWFNPGVASKKELYDFQSKFAYFQAYQQNKIYSYSYSGNEFWERSAIEPQHVLSDLIQILHPELKLTKNYYFYKQLTK
ncbi:MAG: ABC transporter substrate-binding protein [Flavobacteriia bacterium]|nr:ABC transporter substrate-binding protein [Flavobacteriia bacterium]